MTSSLPGGSPPAFPAVEPKDATDYGPGGVPQAMSARYHRGVGSPVDPEGGRVKERHGHEELATEAAASPHPVPATRAPAVGLLPRRAARSARRPSLAPLGLPGERLRAAAAHALASQAVGAALLCLLACLAPAATAASDAPARPTLAVAAFHEALNPEVDVSGGVRAGVMTGALDPALKRRQLLVHLSRPIAAETICVELSSRDGRYAAQLSVDGPVAEPGWYVVPFETTHAREITGREGVYLAALATVRESCDAEVAEILLAGWDEPVDRRRFTVIVNSGRLDSVLKLDTNGGATLDFPCVPLADEQLVAFDKRCDVVLPEGAEVVGGRLVRKRLFNVLPAVDIPLRP